MADLRLDGVRVYVGPVGADAMDPDSAEWTTVGWLDPKSVVVMDHTGEPDSVVWTATLHRQPDGWHYANWWDLREGTGGELVEVEPSSVVDTPIDDAPEPSAPDRNAL